MDAARYDRLDQLLTSDSRLAEPGGWLSRSGQGECLLFMLAPECKQFWLKKHKAGGVVTVPMVWRVCPPEVAPLWLAATLLSVGDTLVGCNKGCLVRFAYLARHWPKIPEDGWQRVLVGFVSYLVRQQLGVLSGPVPTGDDLDLLESCANRFATHPLADPDDEDKLRRLIEAFVLSIGMQDDKELVAQLSAWIVVLRTERASRFSHIAGIVSSMASQVKSTVAPVHPQGAMFLVNGLFDRIEFEVAMLRAAELGKPG